MERKTPVVTIIKSKLLSHRCFRHLLSITTQPLTTSLLVQSVL